MRARWPGSRCGNRSHAGRRHSPSRTRRTKPATTAHRRIARFLRRASWRRRCANSTTTQKRLADALHGYLGSAGVHKLLALLTERADAVLASLDLAQATWGECRVSNENRSLRLSIVVAFRRNLTLTVAICRNRLRHFPQRRETEGSRMFSHRRGRARADPRRPAASRRTGPYPWLDDYRAVSSTGESSA